MRYFLGVAVLMCAGVSANAQVKLPTATGPVKAPEAKLELPIADPVAATVNVEGNGRVKINNSQMCQPEQGAKTAACQRTVQRNGRLTLVASGQYYDHFFDWQGACAGQQETCVLNPRGPVTTTARFGPQTTSASVQVVTDPGGIVTAAPFATAGLDCTIDSNGVRSGPCWRQVKPGEQISLDVKVLPGFTFAGWSTQQLGCAGQKCDFVMGAKETILYAKIVDNHPTRTLSVSFTRGKSVTARPQTNTGAVFTCGPDTSPNGASVWNAMCTTQVAPGTAVYLTIDWVFLDGSHAPDPVKDKGWGGACSNTTGKTCIVTLDQSKNVIATD